MPQKVEFSGNRVIKKVSSSQIELEASMTMAAYRLAQSSGMFRVPKVIEFSKENERLTLEYIPNIKPLYLFMNDKEIMRKIMEKSGACLAFIHKNLKPDNEKISLFDKLNFTIENEQNCFLHGDYSLVNVQYDIHSGQLVIIDWSLTPLLNSSANFGSIYWDIGWHLIEIIAMPPYYLFRSNYRCELANIFLENYFKNSVFIYDEKKMKHCFTKQYLIQSSKHWKQMKIYSYRKRYRYIGLWKMKSKFDIFPIK